MCENIYHIECQVVTISELANIILFLRIYFDSLKITNKTAIC